MARLRALLQKVAEDRIAQPSSPNYAAIPKIALMKEICPMTSPESV